MTVFLTTQYLEEADALADRVGIIDTGTIVAEGTPDALKAEIGRPTVEAAPVEPSERERMAAVLERFGEPTAASPGGAAVRLDEGTAELADVVRALDSRGHRGSPTSRSTRRRSTTSSSPRPASGSRAPADAAGPTPTGELEAVPLDARAARRHRRPRSRAASAPAR